MRMESFLDMMTDSKNIQTSFSLLRFRLQLQPVRTQMPSGVRHSDESEPVSIQRVAPVPRRPLPGDQTLSSVRAA